MDRVHRRDEGLYNLLPPELTDYGKQCELKAAILRYLDEGQSPSLEPSRGDREMHLDAVTYWHFRVRVAGVPLFVKVFLDEEGAEPDVLVISVKRDDRKW